MLMVDARAHVYVEIIALRVAKIMSRASESFVCFLEKVSGMVHGVVCSQDDDAIRID
jgi:hypothetical protein